MHTGHEPRTHLAERQDAIVVATIPLPAVSTTTATATATTSAAASRGPVVAARRRLHAHVTRGLAPCGIDG